MTDGIRICDACGFNKGRSSKFREGSRVWQTPEEDGKTYRPKRRNNNKDEDNNSKTANDKNNEALSHKFIDKHLKKAGWHIDRNVVEITIKMKTTVRKLLMIKILQTTKVRKTIKETKKKNCWNYVNQLTSSIKANTIRKLIKTAKPTPLNHLMKNNREARNKKDIADTLAETSTKSLIKNAN